MTQLRNGKEWSPKRVAVTGDEPIMPHARMYPSFDPPTLLDLLMAFSTYAVSKCGVREDRMMEIHRMIADGEYDSGLPA